MRAALAEHNFEIIRGIGHNCRGIGGGYGFPGVSEIGMALEEAAKSSDLAGLETSIARFEEYLQSVTETHSPN